MQNTNHIARMVVEVAPSDAEVVARKINEAMACNSIGLRCRVADEVLSGNVVVVARIGQRIERRA